MGFEWSCGTAPPVARYAPAAAMPVSSGAARYRGRYRVR
ncbi:hypothetical protein L810_8148 [Burkholderia sp. AU4i]|nr:hypothetical protein L810_8148 [Burkholderia sp. AU4i]